MCDTGWGAKWSLTWKQTKTSQNQSPNWFFLIPWENNCKLKPYEKWFSWRNQEMPLCAKKCSFKTTKPLIKICILFSYCIIRVKNESFWVWVLTEPVFHPSYSFTSGWNPSLARCSWHSCYRGCCQALGMLVVYTPCRSVLLFQHFHALEFCQLPLGNFQNCEFSSDSFRFAIKFHVRQQSLHRQAWRLARPQ